MTLPQAAIVFLLAFVVAIALGATPPRLAGIELQPIVVEQLAPRPVAIPRALCPGWSFRDPYHPREADMVCTSERGSQP